MASHRPAERPNRVVVRTEEFRRWQASLDPERGAAVDAAVARIREVGPTLGRPRVDVIHGGRLHKLKEARLRGGVRLLFAFDSNRNPVMLIGGGKAGQWDRWYPLKIRQAERLYLDHERSIGKGDHCQSQHRAQQVHRSR